MMLALWILLACAPMSLSAGEGTDGGAIVGGPVGAGQPINTEAWFLLPANAEGASTAPGPAELRRYRVVERTGTEVPVTRTLTHYGAGTLIRIKPTSNLSPLTEYKVLAPGALLLTFATGKHPDPVPPAGGTLQDWVWSRAGCPSLTVKHTPVKDTSPIFWEVQATRADKPAPPMRGMGPATGAATAEPLVIHGCSKSGLKFPEADIDLQLRWVDGAGNAGEWSPPVRVPAARGNAAGFLKEPDTYTP